MVVDDPAVAAIQQELEKALPMIKAAKAGLEDIVGEPVGAGTVLTALFIVFCGRSALMIIDKLITNWLEERREWRSRMPPPPLPSKPARTPRTAP